MNGVLDFVHGKPWLILARVKCVLERGAAYRNAVWGWEEGGRIRGDM